MVLILDSTLREGEQTPGVYFETHQKLAIANYLNHVGVDVIEAGHPVVSREIKSAVRLISRADLRPKIGAHARSLEKDVNAALECGVGFLGIFYCVSDDRLNGVARTSLNRAIDQITKIIGYAKEKNPDILVRYTPEDTVRSEFDNVLEAALEAVNAGADIISVADTTGYMVPWIKDRNMYDFVLRLKDGLYEKGAEPKIAIHCHNDRNLGLANALEGFIAGADIIDATVMGLGERAGLVDLASLLSALSQDFEVKNDWDLTKLLPLYNLVSEYSGIRIPLNYPIAGKNAFTHCAGIHTHAAEENPLHYSSLDPKIFGREMNVALDHMSGESSIKWGLDKINVSPGKELVGWLNRKIREIGMHGRTASLTELKHLVDEFNIFQGIVEGDQEQ